MKPEISIAVILSKNRVIAKNGEIPWKISEDLKRFKRITFGHPVIMGRKTFETLPKPLDGRLNIVITHNDMIKNQISKIKNVVAASSLKEAIEKAKKNPGSDEIFIIGGGQIFEQVIGITDKLYLTIVDEEIDGDIFFPDYSDFRKVLFEEKRESQGYKYTFIDLVKS
ncbi:MAG: dihydrofolate reductase [Patescibacteria group bacterium]|nr:dihydrofolate reductase [Patescibacteria group bacterium]